MTGNNYWRWLSSSILILFFTTTITSFVCGLSGFSNSDLHKSLVRDGRVYVALSDSPLFWLYWYKDTSPYYNATIVSEFDMGDAKRIVGLSVATPDYLISRSPGSMSVTDVMVFDGSVAYDRFYKPTDNKTDVTNFSTFDIFHKCIDDGSDGGSNDLFVTRSYEMNSTENTILKVIQFIRLKNTTDNTHDTFLPSKSNARGIMFLNFATWTVNSSSSDIFSNFEISSNSGYGWYEFQSVYFYPISSTLNALRIVHGVLMLIGFSILLVLGMLSSRHLKDVLPTKKWVPIHVTLMIASIICILVAFILSIISCSLATNRHFDSIHKYIGIVILILLVAYQFVMSGPVTFVWNNIINKNSKNNHRGKEDDEEEQGFISKTDRTKTFINSALAWTHVWGGRILIAAGCLNLYFGVHGIYASMEWFIGLSIFLFVVLLFIAAAEIMSGKNFKRLMKGKFKKLVGSQNDD